MQDDEITILIIDDEKIIRQVFSYYLEDKEYTVITADNGRAGIELFDSHNPDVVLTDLRMPKRMVLKSSNM